MTEHARLRSRLHWAPSDDASSSAPPSSELSCFLFGSFFFGALIFSICTIIACLLFVRRIGSLILVCRLVIVIARLQQSDLRLLAGLDHNLGLVHFLWFGDCLGFGWRHNHQRSNTFGSYSIILSLILGFSVILLLFFSFLFCLVLGCRFG